MRRFLVGFVVAAIAAVTPTLAMAGNQEIADQIANRFRHSSQMQEWKNWKIGVKYQDGKAWLRGRVASQQQLKVAEELVFQTASVDQIDVSGMVIAPSEAKTAGMSRSTGNPLRDANTPVRDRNVMQVSGTQAEESAAMEEPRELPRQLNVTPKPTNVDARMAAREPAKVAMPPAIQMPQPVPVAVNGAPLPMSAGTQQPNVMPAHFNQPCMPNYAWPSYAAYPNEAAVTYPKQYSAQAWPYIGPFYPYPQVPMGWRKVTLQWDSGWWFLDFKDQPASFWHR